MLLHNTNQGVHIIDIKNTNDNEFTIYYKSLNGIESKEVVTIPLEDRNNDIKIIIDILNSIIN
jgi:hypothetical protein